MDGPTDLDALAEALRQDGVVIDRVMGSGEAEQAHDRIAALVREVPFPVYVALVEHPDELPGASSSGASEVVATMLNRRLGDGLYVVDTTESIHQVFSFGLDAHPTYLSLGGSRNVDALDLWMEKTLEETDAQERRYSTPAFAKAEAQVLAAENLVAMARQPSGTDSPVTIERADLDELAERAVELARRAEWRPARRPHVEVRQAQSGSSALAGGLTGLVVALLLGQSLRGWPRTRKPLGGQRTAQLPVAAPPDLDQERALATKLAGELASELEGTDWATVRDRHVADRALTARDAVEQLLTSDDVADLIGAQVIARAGVHDLARGRAGTGGPLATCFFDPRHPDASRAVSWRLGDGEIEVPCCTSCRNRARTGRTPHHLRLPSRRATVAYWERGDIWARTGFGAVSGFLARQVLADRAGEG